MDISDILNLIKSRRSIRNFKSEKVFNKTLYKLLEAGIWAPTGSNMQAWFFGIIDDDRLMEKIITFSPGLLGKPPCAMILCYDKNLAEKKGGKLGRDTLAIMDISMAAQNIMLYAEEKNISTCPVKSFNKNAVKKILELPENIVPELIISLGYTEEKPQPPKRKKNYDVHFYNKWGNKFNE